MDEVLSSLLDGGTDFIADPTTKKKYESVQSRFQRFHMPLTGFEWILCDQCGLVINHKIFQQHLMQHEIQNLVYQLCHYEIGEEKWHQERIKCFRRKEAAREDRLLRGYRQTSYSSRESSISGSFSDTSSIASSFSDSSRPSSPEKRDLGHGMTQQQSSDLTGNFQRKRGPARLVRPKPMKNGEVSHKNKSKPMKKRPTRAEALTRTSNDKASKKQEIQTCLEHQLCLKHLGPKYFKVFVDLRKQRHLFNYQGRVRHKGLTGLQSPPPTGLRRSLRGALKVDSREGEDMELVALL